MKKTSLTLIFFAALALPAGATLVVHDPIHTLVNQGNWLITEIKQGLQYEKQLEQAVNEKLTALKEVQQVENEIVQLERMGDPKAYGANLPGVQAITGLAQIYQAGKQDVEDWASFANPQAAKLTAEQIMGLYSNSLNGLTTSGGFHIPPAQGLIQFSTSNYNVAQTTIDKIDPLTQQKLQLTQARDTAIAQMKAAPSQSEAQKEQAIIDSLNGAIADVNASIQQAAAISNLQIQKNQAAEQVYQGAVTVQSVNTLNASVKTEIGTLEGLSTGFGDAPHWGGN
jgi:hypothetical protein